MLAPPAEQDRAHRGIAAERAEGVADRGEHVLVHGVELVRPGKLDMGDAAFDADRDPLASHASSPPLRPVP